MESFKWIRYPEFDETRGCARANDEVGDVCYYVLLEAMKRVSGSMIPSILLADILHSHILRDQRWLS